MRQSSYQELIRFPELTDDSGSLTMMEKSLLGHFILLTRPHLIIELGVYRALTTQFMCDFLSQNRIDGYVVGFDLPAVVAELRKSQMIQDLESCNRLSLIPGSLPESLTRWLDQTGESFGLALVDATHNYGSVKGELELLWPRLAEGGFILCHDYSDKYEGVRYAVDSFATKNDAMVLALTSSEAAQAAGYGSVLVAVTRHPYKFHLSRLFYHRWLAVKTRLLAISTLHSLWHRVRPLVKPAKRD